MNPDAAHTRTPAAPQPTRFDTFRARVMFLLAFVYLLLVAGIVHRALTASVAAVELKVMYAGLAALWPVFVAEAVWGVLSRDRSKPRGPVVWRAGLVCLMPPWRMAAADPRTGLVWVPRLGWRAPGKELFKRLELVFGGPMLLFAFLILPVLLFEYLQTDEARNTPAVALALDVGISVIWVAFATEFVFLASAHPRPFRFARDRWLDAAIVLLPMLEFVLTHLVDAAPIARLLRLGRAISPEQLARMQRLYRLRGLAMKGWHALLLLEGLARLIGQTPEKRLARLEEKIAELEEELADLRRDAETVRAQVEPPAPPEDGQNQPDASSAGRTGSPSGEVVTLSSRPSGP